MAHHLIRWAGPSPSDFGILKTPNIILVMADDIGVEGFGCYGGESYQTPHIDQMAEEGVIFRHAHSQPLCTPSRVKIMTGLSNIRNYVAFSILDPQAKTFAHPLRDHGYLTGVMGKWQLYGANHYRDFRVGSGATPSDAGFDHYCLWQVEKLGSRYWNPLIDEQGTLTRYDEDQYGPDIFLKFAETFLDQWHESSSNNPFLLYYPMALPHDPFVATPQSEDRGLKGPAAFADMVARVDHNLGALLQALEQRELRDNTLVIFTSDNGTHRKIRSIRQGKGIRGGKSLSTDAGTHVPLVVSWPAQHKPGHQVDDLIDFSDFFPTLLDAAEIDLSPDMACDGRSFLPQVRGESGHPRQWSFCYSNPRPGKKRLPEVRFVRTQHYKLYSTGEFFDVRKDPEQISPLEPSLEGLDDESRKAYLLLQEALATMPSEAMKLRMAK